VWFSRYVSVAAGPEQNLAEECSEFVEMLVDNADAHKIADQEILDLNKALLYCSWTEKPEWCTDLDKPNPYQKTIAANIDVAWRGHVGHL
jgi:hypothetical protein